jgi:4-hydroxybenzoyl-CoA thioesterase/acyl-CoA thioester hydrolase
MPGPYRTSRRVEFSDTDLAGIAHFTAFFRYMEEAEHALRRELGGSVMQPLAGGGAGEHVSWPRVSASCEYASAAHFEDVLDIEVSVRRLGEKSATYGIEFSLAGKPIAQGQMTSVCCRITPGQPPRSMKIPDELAAGLRAYLRDEP